MKRPRDSLTDRQQLLTTLKERPILRKADRTAKPIEREREQLEAAGQLSLPFPPAPPTKAG